jgi:hypothetical protein
MDWNEFQPYTKTGFCKITGDPPCSVQDLRSNYQETLIIFDKISKIWNTSFYLRVSACHFFTFIL